MKLHAEWIHYMDAYRIYDPTKPQQTIAYDDRPFDEISSDFQAKGYDISLADSDTMHIEILGCGD